MGIIQDPWSPWVPEWFGSTINSTESYTLDVQIMSSHGIDILCHQVCPLMLADFQVDNDYIIPPPSPPPPPPPPPLSSVGRWCRVDEQKEDPIRRKAWVYFAPVTCVRGQNWNLPQQDLYIWTCVVGSAAHLLFDVTEEGTYEAKDGIHSELTLTYRH